ncbi:MAG: MEDS domain-containing protein [Actinomycetota bacterium]
MQEMLKTTPHTQFGEHLCCVYESVDDKLSMIVPFISIGLELNEKCVCIADQSTLSRLEKALERIGVDVDRYQDFGQLILKTDAEICPLVKSFISDDNRESGIRALARETLSEGYRGYRSVVDVTQLINDIDGNALIHREIKLNTLLPKIPAMMLLLYNRAHLPEYVISDIFRIHPRIVDGAHVYENPHFIPPDELL